MAGIQNNIIIVIDPNFSKWELFQNMIEFFFSQGAIFELIFLCMTKIENIHHQWPAVHRGPWIIHDEQEY